MYRVFSKIFLVLLSTTLLIAKDRAVVEVFSEEAVGGMTLEAFKKDQTATHAWLVSEQLPISHETMLSIQPNPNELDELDSIGKGREQIKKLKVGLYKSTNLDVNFDRFSPASLPGSARLHANGILRTTADGGFVWSMGVTSEGATGLRIHLSNFNLPKKTELYIFTQEGQAFGPYMSLGPNGNGDFWTHTVFSSIAFLQLRHYGPISREDLQELRLTIQDVAHIGAKFQVPFFEGRKELHSKACSFNADCVEDGSCFSTGDWGAINDARKGVAHILFAAQGGFFICSGGLLADTDSSTQVPLFLTANHCISKASEASSMEGYWQFQTSSCNGTCITRNDVTLTTNGATILSTSSTSDYTLMQLSDPAPAGSVFMGWTNQAVAFSANTDLYRLSHPKGAPQAFSQHSVDTQAGTCSIWPRGNWIYSEDVIGATEGGSSGSPVCNAAGQVVGQLSGACGFNPSDPCDTAANSTVDGALAAYFSNVEQYLDPNTGGGFSLSATGFKVKGKHNIDLSWSGATGSNVDIYRDGSLLTTTANDGSYTDSTNNRGKRTYVYQVCEAGSGTCSNSVTVSF